MSSHPSIPTATYRLQFHQDFPFGKAQEIVPYLKKLGISHVYASPIFRASSGSQHGYDVCDHNALNPELGDRNAFEALSQELQEHDMGLILDFVPNHMGICESENRWWMDVLENGSCSHFAKFFDIDWTPIKRELENKILLPILGDQYGRVLEAGALKVIFTEGLFRLTYEDRLLPISVRTILPLLQKVIERLQSSEIAPPLELESIAFGLTHLPNPESCDSTAMADLAREREAIRHRLIRLCEEEPKITEVIQAVLDDLNQGGVKRDFDELDQLLCSQHYRLASWQVAGEQINYRRFFDVNTLAALRMEVPEVFEATHQLIFELLSTGAVTGLRIDHIDGLNDPRRYLDQLQKRFAELHGLSETHQPLYLLVEKILGRHEALRNDWPVHGTTGYEFAAQVTDLLVDSHAAEEMTQVYQRFTGITMSHQDCAYRGKLLVMRSSMASEVNVLANLLSRIAESNRWYRDFTLEALRQALREVIACFPVYRTYISPDGDISLEDRRHVLRAIAAARRKNPELERTVFEFIRDVYLPPENATHPVDEEARRRFVLKLQQCTGAITAKGVEDTAFYAYTRFVALNEVGNEPGIFGQPSESFHQQNRDRQQSHPHCMLATSTHDTKRSEDVRARLMALSEMPEEWGRAIRSWRRMNRKYRKEVDGAFAPDDNEEYLLYQTLLGSWPNQPFSEKEREEYIQRIQHYMMKALHEAKVNSSWIEPHAAWDDAVSQFVRRILTPGRGNKFEEAFVPLAKRVAEVGAINSLSQVVLKLTSPGVPDVYQGQECWDFSLVDPDNRRAVDYDKRQALLESLEDSEAPDLLRNWQDDRLKLFVTSKLLQLRQRLSDLFEQGGYEALNPKGEFSAHCIAYRRFTPSTEAIIIVPRLTMTVGSPPIGEAWKDTAVDFSLSGDMRDLFTGTMHSEKQAPMLATLLKRFPVAVLINESRNS